jgi:predicted MFS family arabinose efflux permease
MGAKQTGVPGGVMTALLAPSLVVVVGWRGALAALGLINFLFAFLFSSLWREPASDLVNRVDRAEAEAAGHNPLNVWALLPVSCATAIYLIGQMAVITYVPLYLKDIVGFSPYWASQALALTQAGAMAGRIGWGVASDRLFGGRRKAVLIIIGLSATVSIARWV